MGEDSMIVTMATDERQFGTRTTGGSQDDGAQQIHFTWFTVSDCGLLARLAQCLCGTCTERSGQNPPSLRFPFTPHRVAFIHGLPGSCLFLLFILNNDCRSTQPDCRRVIFADAQHVIRTKDTAVISCLKRSGKPTGLEQYEKNDLINFNGFSNNVYV
ncbi:hypothetical protein F2P81_019293 [Scophthalmus maximus]|uniref:Uncharacterized protein n=1 Tax=Scophthalmus maximus TaxID=52904 RepID=A0A6A4RZ93_SCOMX|nr:hypothetical protein F2P81_019293 [Scophthalmus maximus]